MAPQVPGLFYATKLQASLAWWKQPLNFASKKVVRYIEHGVKVEFKKGLPFAPKPSAPKFVDPQDVDFAIQDLLKGRRIGAYQETWRREASSFSPDQGFTLLRARESSASSMPSAASTRLRSNVKPPTRIFACSSQWSDPKILC
jgi:hypothetical protein